MPALIFQLRRAISLSLICSLLVLPLAPLQAADAPRGAPSVHLRYDESDFSSFYSEVTVKRTAAGSFFMVTGWHNGYFGMQDKGDGRRVLLFSVWGSREDNPASGKGKGGVTLIRKDAAVQVGRFGNEGSGMQAFLDFDWKANTTYAFMVKARLFDDRAEYSGYVRSPETQWRHLVTFSTPFEPTLLRGLHSFIEDFRRDQESAKETRRAIFSNAWARRQDGSTLRLLGVSVTSAPRNARGIDAEVTPAGITLVTGGYTENLTTPQERRIDRMRSINDDLPGDL